ncbi:MAG: cell division protein FtsA [Puniceicoccales bacterium]|jgi:cell division protein FtsA|nr:cell division protein FtsA [Puniceicoccales bacterium]
MSSSNIIAATDIGTSKTVVLIAQLQAGRPLEIIGFGEVSSQGMRKGAITSLKDLTSAVHAALAAAEKTAGVELRSTYVSLSGAHLGGQSCRGVVTLSAANKKRVDAADIKRAQEEARRAELSNGRVFVHYSRQPFLLDGEECQKPEGMTGGRLEACYWAVDADANHVRNLLQVPGGYSLHVDDLIASSMASGSIVVADSLKQHGVLVVDIGAGTTDYVLYQRGYVVCTGVLPIGGQHITNDLCLGLRVNPPHAEKIKQEFGSAVLQEADANHTIWLYGDKTVGDRKFFVKSINQIISARVDETFGFLRRRIERYTTLDKVAAGVVLTGGSACLRDIERAAAQALGMDARPGEFPEWVLKNLAKPQYSAALGLLHFGRSERLRPVAVASKPGLFGTFGRWLGFGPNTGNRR